MLKFTGTIYNDKPFIKFEFFDKIDKSSYAYTCLSGTVEAPDKTQRCIISVFDQVMRPFFSQDNLMTMLSKSDFNFDAIGKNKTALFLIMHDEKTTYHKLISIFIKQCYEQLIFEAQTLKDSKFPVRINFLLDEFSSLPPIPDFPNMITASRSRNIRFNLIIQSMHQLKYRYGEEQAEVIKGNCTNWVYLASKELPLLRELSELAGTKRNNVPLISIAALQRLNKEKGQALVFHDRFFPFITMLEDIKNYRMGEPEDAFEYPLNENVIDVIFDFAKYCTEHSDIYLERLFSGKTSEEIKKDMEKENMNENALAEEKIRKRQEQKKKDIFDW